MGMKSVWFWGIGCLLVGWGLVCPSAAERLPAVKYEVVELEDRDALQRAERERVGKIFNDYMWRMRAVEKKDNDVRYLVAQSNSLQFEELANFIDKNILPLSQEELSLAGEITSQSSALRQLHASYLEYVTARHQALSALSVYARERAPKTTIVETSSYQNRFASGSSTYYSDTEEHIPSHVYDRVASLRAAISSADTYRQKYYNRLEYNKHKKLEINGVGFRLSGGGKSIEMALGFSHPVKYQAPDGVELKTDKMTITVSGIDKQQVGQVAAEIRALKKPEPYKGKGIKYVDEVILRKAGKAGKK